MQGGDPDWAQVGVSPASDSAGRCLTPLFSFPASHYYKYKQQFIFPGTSPRKSLWYRGALR